MENQSIILDQEENLLNVNSNIDEQKVITLWQFVLLSILTFGVYEIWWMYKSWRFYKQKENLDIMPAARAIFCIFFLNSLFEKNLQFARQKGYQESYSSTALFVGFVLFNFSSRLPEPFWLISLLGVFVLIPPFLALNFAFKNSTEFAVKRQTSFNARQIVLIILGVAFWSLVILGLYAGGESVEY